MNKILSFFRPKETPPKKTPKMVKPRVVNNSSNTEFDKIANYHYQSKFTNITEKIHDKVSLKSHQPEAHSLPPCSDIEELEVLRTQSNSRVNGSILDLSRFDLLILSSLCFCVEFGFL